jgi:hypothetical protein
LLELIDAISLIKLYGPTLVAVVFFLWRDWQREGRLSQRIDALQEEQRDILLPMIKEATAVISKNTTVIEMLEKHLMLPR